MKLVTDPLKLPRSSLDGPAREAVDRVTAARHFGPGELVLDGLTFVPDGLDARKGGAFALIGGLTALFGVVFAGIVVDGKQDEPWMRWAAPALIAIGGWTWWRGHKDKQLALQTPRVTGAYLLPDLLLHVEDVGCRTFPKSTIVGFEYRATSEGSHHKLFVRYRHAGEEREDVLFYLDATKRLNAWLHGGAGD